MKKDLLNTLLFYNSENRKGLVLLGLMMIVFQILIIYNPFGTSKKMHAIDESWVLLQLKFDSIKKTIPNEKVKIFPFNPNFISDFKGYQLGMTVEEIDRLLDFRKQNKFVNSANEFQQVTKISDSLLKAISPYFKFPDWVVNKSKQKSHSIINYSATNPKNSLTKKDLNLATQDDLMSIFGIGPAISERILNERQKYGAFVDMQQIQDIWGLSFEVQQALMKYFYLENFDQIKKYDINKLSVKELSKVPFLNNFLAKEIVIYRSMNVKINTSDDLKNIKALQDKNLDILGKYFNY